MDVTISNSMETLNRTNSNVYKKYGQYAVLLDESSYSSISDYEKDYVLYICFGDLYLQNDDQINNAFKLYEEYTANGIQSLYKIDGDFLFFCIDKVNNSIISLAHQYGLIPLYYRLASGEFTISTDVESFFDNFLEDDLDFSSIYDYLRYGTMIGNHTFSNKIKLLQGGNSLIFDSQKLEITEHYFFRFDSNNAVYDKEWLLENVLKKFESSVLKRTRIPIDDSVLFLSGGLDSRFLLAVINRLFSQRIDVCSYGQENSEETKVANLVANLGGNRLIEIELKPKDFLDSISVHSKMIAGMDVFPQSYIIKVISQLNHKVFFTGFAQDVLLGGLFLNDDAINTNLKFSQFLDDNLGLVKMNIFSNDEFEKLIRPEFIELFRSKSNNLRVYAESKNHYKVRDIIQSFAFSNRSIRLVLLRDIVPSKYLKYVTFAFDRELLDIIRLIPAEWRNNNAFYRDLFVTYFHQYAEVVNNNTTLPILDQTRKWDIAQNQLLDKEISHKTKNHELNLSNKQKKYYKQYYSDFDGYVKYDKDWRKIIETYLLNENSHIYTWFDYNEVIKLYRDNIVNNYNNRKKLIYLTSLELFLSSHLRY
jgi:asparagine synthase (glutamine-hydrolysing)